MSFKLQLGLNHCTNDQYHSDREYLSSSKLKTLLESPAQFKRELDNPPPPQKSSSLDLGTYVHSLCLEPHLVADEYAIFPGFRRAGDAYEQFKVLHPGKKIIAASMDNQAKRMVASIRACPPLLDLLKEGESELSIATEINGVKVKARFDRIFTAGAYILDIKTSRDSAGKDEFKQTIKEYEYDLSAALYAAVAEAHYNKQFDFYWGVLSKTEPPESRVYKASKATMEKGLLKVYMALDIYKQCMATNVWPETLAPKTENQEMVEEI